MAFCPKCGFKNDDDALFCRQCGASFNRDQASAPAAAPVQTASPVNDALSSVVQQEQIRASEIEKIDNMLKHFRSKQKLYEDYDTCIRNKAMLNDPSQIHVEGTKKVWPFLVFGPIIAVPGTYFALASLVNSRLPMWLAAFVFAIGVGLLVFGIIRSVKNRKLTGKFMSETSEQTGTHMTELAEKLQTHYEQFGPCELELKDTEPKRLEKLKEYISTGKADTVEEAVRILHREFR